MNRLAIFWWVYTVGCIILFLYEDCDWERKNKEK